jgi:hypothetical protein
MLDNIEGILLGPALLGTYTDHIGEAICICFWIFWECRCIAQLVSIELTTL